MKEQPTSRELRSRMAYRLAIKHYWNVTKRNWKTSFPGLILPGIGSIFVFYVPSLVVSALIARYSQQENTNLTDAIPYVAVFAGAWLFGEMLFRIGTYFLIKTETKAAQTLYENGLSLLLEKDLDFFHNNFAGSLTKKTTGYANRYIDTCDTMTYNVLTNIIPVFFAAYILGSYSAWLVIMLLTWIVLIIFIVIPLIKQRRKIVVERETASNVLTGHIADVYSNIDAVRAFAKEDFENDRNKHLTKKLTSKMKHSWDFQNKRIDLIISPFYVLSNASGLLLALYLVQIGQISIAKVIVVFAFYARVTSFMWEFNGVYRRIESALSDAAQYTELLLEEPKIHDPISATAITKHNGALSFNNVSFAYNDDSANNLFSNFNLEVKSGEKIGLVGHSGGGKTTVTKLLLRFMDITGGSLKIDGRDIRSMSQKDLRSLIAYVPQDPAMFHRSIADNIRYAIPSSDMQTVQSAARKAHADEFVNSLPQGYETLIGERGVKLSGGQRQRIAIARSVLKNAPILLLDEATSALDSESEKLIQDALWKLMENKTAIVIAHRLSTIQKMDRILVLENGEIAEEGTHKELLAKKGVYAGLWAHQSGGFLED